MLKAASPGESTGGPSSNPSRQSKAKAPSAPVRPVFQLSKRRLRRYAVFRTDEAEHARLAIVGATHACTLRAKGCIHDTHLRPRAPSFYADFFSYLLKDRAEKIWAGDTKRVSVRLCYMRRLFLSSQLCSMYRKHSADAVIGVTCRPSAETPQSTGVPALRSARARHRSAEDYSP